MGGVIYIYFLYAVFDTGVSSKKHGHEKASGGKIVGGYNATICEYPYQVYILLQKGQDYYQCGGSIISARAVLTAGHCLFGMQRAYMRIGSTNSDSGGTEYQSSMLLTHPMYNARASDYDVGVIRLLRSMKLDGKTSKAIQLSPSGANVPAGSNVVVTGWGTTSENGRTSGTLLAVKVPVISNADCSKKLSGITPRMFCAAENEGGKDSCQGDSGGPATEKGIQRGIVSFGVGCARKGFPGVYTNVSDPSIRNWIKLISGV